MQLKHAIAIVVFTALVMTSGCAALLEGDRLREVPHEITPYVPDVGPPEERIEISDYEELKAVMLDMIMDHEITGQLVANSFDGEDIQSDIDRAANELMNHHPVGAYAVSIITGVAARVSTYYEIDISIEYKRTKEQMDSIVNVSTIRYLRTELLSIISDYHEEAVFQSALNITEEDIREYAREIYYDNPRYIIMLPVIAFEAFPQDGEDRVIELRFAYIDQTSILLQYSSSLTAHVRGNAGLAVGRNDGETLLSLVENLVATVSFDGAAARSISEHGAQNFAATAFGALVRQNAVGEGFAMAFKALCDELGFDCRVVLGYVDEMIHAWNIVSLGGEYYHIDVAMGALNGIETAFLKTDEDLMQQQYIWDFENTISCNGTLTYEDIVFTEEQEHDDGMDEADGEINDESNGETSEAIIEEENEQSNEEADEA